MAIFELNRGLRVPEVVRSARAGRRLAIYAAGLAAGVGLGVGLALMSPAETAAPSTPTVTARVPDYVQPITGAAPEGVTLPLPVADPAADPPFALPEISIPAPVVEAPMPVASPANGAPKPATNTVQTEQPAAPVAEPAAPSLPANFYLPAAPAGDSAMAQDIFTRLNAERAAAGVPAMSWDGGVATIARIRSQQMIDQGYFGHRDPAGYSMYYELLKHHGYGYAWAGENLHRNNYAYAEQAEVAVRGFMNSQTHRDNVLYTGFNRMGIGAVQGTDGKVYITVIFLG